MTFSHSLGPAAVRGNAPQREREGVCGALLPPLISWGASRPLLVGFSIAGGLYLVSALRENDQERVTVYSGLRDNDSMCHF